MQGRLLLLGLINRVVAAVPITMKDDVQEAGTALGRIALDRKAIFLSRFRATHVVNGVLQVCDFYSDPLSLSLE